MEKDNFFKNSFFLTAANITTGILGFIFSIYLSKLIGPEGIGLYGLVMPIYNLFICLMTAGIIAAISQRAAIYTSRGEYNNLFKTINTVAFFNIIWSIAIGILVFILAPYISQYGVKDMRTLNAIRVTCPAQARRTPHKRISRQERMPAIARPAFRSFSRHCAFPPLHGNPRGSSRISS